MVSESKIVEKELFILNDKEWIISGFSDQEDNNKDWYNLYDYEYLLKTGELVPFYKHEPNVKIVDLYGESHLVLTKEELLSNMTRDGFRSSFTYN